MSFNIISVIGLGYIGLPTAAMFASREKKVVGVDVNEGVVDTINQGEIHIVEPELDRVVHAAVTKGFLRATLKPVAADAFLVAVPTPFKKNDSTVPEPDLSFVRAAAKAIAPVLKKGDLVVLESTSPVGATEQMAEWLAEARGDLSFPQQVGAESDIRVAHCPERVLPGQVVRELVENDRVIGGMTTLCSEKAIELYKTFVQGECVITNSRTAEMAKLTENSCRDVQIAFANELSVICDKLEINVWELISLANRHPRINILQPGPGVGGHCIAVDPWFIVASSQEEARLIHTARKVNDDKPGWVFERIKQTVIDYLQKHPNKTIADIKIGCFGLAFKPDIDDLRESPAMEIVSMVQEWHNGTIAVVEPNINSLPGALHSCDLQSAEKALDSDVIVMLVSHQEFYGLQVMTSYVVDTRGILING